jgi:hypothetical protein
MKHREFGTHTQAVAGVIEALLMVALVAIIISMIQLVYIPQVMEQKEAEHMDQVFNQFSTMKSMIDLQAMTQSSAPISSMLTLGSRELPYFITAKAYGELSTQEDSVYKITMNPPLQSGDVPLTSIQYEADNSYFVDQSYILEGGGIIVDQPDGTAVMRADPSISAENKTSTITLHFDLPHVVGVAGKTSTYGDGKCFVRTNYSSNQMYPNPIPINGIIRIYTEYVSAWNESLYNMLGMYVTNNIIDIYPVTADPVSYIEIKAVSKGIDLELNVIEMFVQIGPGEIR